jgi:hypothetical protein
MKIMARNSSASPREETPNLREKESDNLKCGDGETGRRGDGETGGQGDGETGGQGDGETACSTLKSHSIDASLRRRARLLITNSSIPRQTRSLIRYALEIKDPYLAQVVRRVEEGEITIDSLTLEQP